MSIKIPSTVDFEHLITAREKLEKIAGLSKIEIGKSGIGTTREKTASTTVKFLGGGIGKSGTKMAKPTLGKKATTSLDHLKNNKRVDTSESVLTRMARIVGINNKTLTKAR